MRIPKFIEPGNVLGLVAPSFGCVGEPYETRLRVAVRRFESQGYQVVCADSCYKSDGLGISTKPEAAADDLVQFYLDKSIDAVLSVGGGELMNETISHVDFHRLAEAEPKWFMGYSDNTNFIFPMALLAQTAGIYGPCAPRFGKPWEQPERDAFALLEGRDLTVKGYSRFQPPEAKEENTDPLARYVLTEKKELTSFVPVGNVLLKAGELTEIRMEGTLLGGCLDVLENLSGTEFDGTRAFCESGKKAVWVLEACDLSPMSIRRTLWHLRHQGWFDTAAGFLIGRPLAAWKQEMMGVNAYNAVTDVLGDLGVPVVMDADVGHISPMMPLIIGAEAVVTASGNDLTVEHLIPEL